MICRDISREPRSSSRQKQCTIRLNFVGHCSGYIFARRSTTPTCISAAFPPTLATATLTPRTVLGMTTCGFTKHCTLLLWYRNGPLVRQHHKPDGTSFARWWTCGKAAALPTSTRYFSAHKTQKTADTFLRSVT